MRKINIKSKNYLDAVYKMICVDFRMSNSYNAAEESGGFQYNFSCAYDLFLLFPLNQRVIRINLAAIFRLCFSGAVDPESNKADCLTGVTTT